MHYQYQIDMYYQMEMLAKGHRNLFCLQIIQHSMTIIGARDNFPLLWQEHLIGVARYINACLQKTYKGQTYDHPSVAGRDVV